MGASADEAALPVIDVDAYTARAEISPYTLGSNHRHAYGGFGMYDEEKDEAYPEFLKKTKEANLGVVRCPGGTIANLFTWKDTIGPREERNNVVPGNSYALVFPYYGLDEHLAYTGEIGAEVIYMVGEAAETPQGAAYGRFGRVRRHHKDFLRPARRAVGCRPSANLPYVRREGSFLLRAGGRVCQKLQPILTFCTFFQSVGLTDTSTYSLFIITKVEL